MSDSTTHLVSNSGDTDSLPKNNSKSNENGMKAKKVNSTRNPFKKVDIEKKVLSRPNSDVSITGNSIASTASVTVNGAGTTSNSRKRYSSESAGTAASLLTSAEPSPRFSFSSPRSLQNGTATGAFIVGTSLETHSEDVHTYCPEQDIDLDVLAHSNQTSVAFSNNSILVDRTEYTSGVAAPNRTTMVDTATGDAIVADNDTNSTSVTMYSISAARNPRDEVSQMLLDVKMLEKQRQIDEIELALYLRESNKGFVHYVFRDGDGQEFYEDRRDNGIGVEGDEVDDYDEHLAIGGLLSPVERSVDGDNGGINDRTDSEGAVDEGHALYLSLRRVVGPVRRRIRELLLSRDEYWANVPNSQQGVASTEQFLPTAAQDIHAAVYNDQIKGLEKRYNDYVTARDSTGNTVFHTAVLSPWLSQQTLETLGRQTDRSGYGAALLRPTAKSRRRDRVLDGLLSLSLITGTPMPSHHRYSVFGNTDNGDTNRNTNQIPLSLANSSTLRGPNNLNLQPNTLQPQRAIVKQGWLLKRRRGNDFKRRWCILISNPLEIRYYHSPTSTSNSTSASTSIVHGYTAHQTGDFLSHTFQSNSDLKSSLNLATNIITRPYLGCLPLDGCTLTVVLHNEPLPGEILPTSFFIEVAEQYAEVPTQNSLMKMTAVIGMGFSLGLGAAGQNKKSQVMQFIAESELEAQQWVYILRAVTSQITPIRGLTAAKCINIEARAVILNLPNESGETPLHTLARQTVDAEGSDQIKALQCMQWLFANECNPYSVNKDGQTASDIAFQKDHLEFVEWCKHFTNRLLHDICSPNHVYPLRTPPTRLPGYSYLSFILKSHKYTPHATDDARFSHFKEIKLTIKVITKYGELIDEIQQVPEPLLRRQKWLFWGNSFHVRVPLENIPEHTSVLLLLTGTPHTTFGMPVTQSDVTMVYEFPIDFNSIASDSFDMIFKPTKQASLRIAHALSSGSNDSELDSNTAGGGRNSGQRGSNRNSFGSRRGSSVSRGLMSLLMPLSAYSNEDAGWRIDPDIHSPALSSPASGRQSLSWTSLSNTVLSVSTVITRLPLMLGNRNTTPTANMTATSDESVKAMGVRYGGGEAAKIGDSVNASIVTTRTF